MEHLDSKATPVSWVFLVHRGWLGCLERRGLRGRKEHWACLAMTVLQATLAGRAPQERKDCRVHPECRVLLDTQANEESRGLMELEDSKEAKARRGRMVSQAPKGRWEEREILETTDLQGSVEKMDLRVLKARWVLKEKPARLALLERRENLEFPDCQGIQVDWAPRVLMDFLVCKARVEKRGRKVQLVHQEEQARGVQMGHEVPEGPKDLQGNQERRAPQDTTALRVLLERGDLKDHKEEMENQDRKDQVVLQGKMDFQVTQGNEESRDSKGRRDLRDPVVLWDHRVNPVSLVLPGTVATLGHLAYLASMVYQALLERKVERVIRVCLAPLERMVLQG